MRAFWFRVWRKGGNKMTDKKQTFDGLHEILLCEVDKIVKTGEINDKQLAQLDTLVDIMKDIKEMEAEDNGYSQRGGNNSMFVSPPMYPYMYDNMVSRNSYGGNSYNNMDYNGGNSNRGGGYSRGSMRDHYEDLMANARTDQERDTIRQMMMRMN